MWKRTVDRKFVCVSNEESLYVYSVAAGATTAILGGILGGIFSLALLLTLLTVFIILAIVWHRKRKANLQG